MQRWPSQASRIAGIVVLGLAFVMAWPSGGAPRAGAAVAGRALPAVVSPWADAAPPATPLVGDSSSPSPSPSPSDLVPTTVASVTSGSWSNQAVKVILSTPDWDPAQVLTYWRLDGGAWTQATELVVHAPDDHANDGMHLLEFYSTDLTGNPGPTGSAQVGIDTRRPTFAWRRLRPNPAVLSRRVRAVFVSRDISPRLHVSYIVEDAWGYRARRDVGIGRQPGRSVIPIPLRYRDGVRFLPGLYRVSIEVTDLAGNHVTSKKRVLRIHRPVAASVCWRLNGVGRRVALTFDDGYSAAAWSSILSTLRANGVHATFFVNGVHVAGYPALARRTVADGHAIGSHTYSHTWLTTVSSSRAVQEVVADRAVWWRVAHTSPLPLFRPPYGAFSATTVRAVGSAGYAKVIIWDVDPTDWASPPSSAIVQRVLSRVRPGSIVLLHVMPNTAQALPAILSGLRARGLQPVTLPALFRAAGKHI